MSFKTVLPWLISLILLLLVITVSILMGLKVNCDECLDCAECDCECNCECEDCITPTSSRLINSGCKPLTFKNTPFTAKRIIYNVYTTGSSPLYISNIGSKIIALAYSPSNGYPYLWDYDGNTLNLNGKILKYVNKVNPTDPNYVNNFYNESGYIQIGDVTGSLGEYWDFDGFNFYLRVDNDKSSKVRYMLTP